MEIEPKTRTFAAEVRGLDLRAPFAKSERRTLHRTMLRYAVLVFPNQDLSREQLVSFAGLFGHAGPNGDISNIDETGQFLPADVLADAAAANQVWHMDIPYQAKPCIYSLLHARDLPPSGGDTQFADLRAAWRELPWRERARLKHESAEHSLTCIRARVGLPPLSGKAVQPVAPRHAETGRRNLFISSHAEQDALIDHASQNHFVYAHRWNVGDVVIWDNRCVLHRVLPYESGVHRRVLYRAEVR